MRSKQYRKLSIQFLLIGVAYCSLNAEPCNAQDSSNEIKRLAKERRDLLSEVATQMTKTYVALERITLQEVVQAERDSLQADLDWFDKPDDRIQAIEKHMKVAESLLKVAKAKVDGARERGYVVLQARAYVLEVQIELLKEKQKAKPRK